MTKLVSAGLGSFMVKRSQESFSTPPRAVSSRLATADLKRLTSARSPLGNPAGVTFGQRVSAHRCSVPLFEVVGTTAPLGQNRRAVGTTSSTRGHRELPPLPTICIQSYFAMGAALRGSRDLVGGGKRREGGGLCHNYFLSFSTPPRAVSSRLATADLKRLTSARSPLGNPAEVRP